MKQRFAAIYFAGIIAETIIRMPYDRQRRQMLSACLPLGVLGRRSQSAGALPITRADQAAPTGPKA